MVKGGLDLLAARVALAKGATTFTHNASDSFSSLHESSATTVIVGRMFVYLVCSIWYPSEMGNLWSGSSQHVPDRNKLMTTLSKQTNEQ